MACGAPSAARAWVSPVRPNLVAQYADALAQPRRPATEETLTMVPPPAARMCGKTARLSRNGTAGAADAGGHAVEAGLAAGEQRHPRPQFRQPHGGGLTKPAAGPGDNRQL